MRLTCQRGALLNQMKRGTLVGAPSLSYDSVKGLEVDLHAQLHDAAGSGSGDPPKVTRCDVVIRVAQLRVVKDVEGLDTHLKGRALPESGVLQEAEVSVVDPRTMDRVTPAIPELAAHIPVLQDASHVHAPGHVSKVSGIKPVILPHVAAHGTGERRVARIQRGDRCQLVGVVRAPIERERIASQRPETRGADIDREARL